MKITKEQLEALASKVAELDPKTEIEIGESEDAKVEKAESKPVADEKSGTATETLQKDSKPQPVRYSIGTPPSGTGPQTLTLEDLDSKSVDWMVDNMADVNKVLTSV